MRDLRADLSYRLSFVLHAVQVALGVASYYFLARFVDRAALGGAAPFPFLLAGLAMNAYMSAWLVCFTEAIRIGQTTGTNKLLFSAPLGHGRLLLFSALYPSVRGALDGAIYVAGGWVLGASFAQANLTHVAIILGLSSLAFAAIGIGSAASALVFKRGDPLVWLLTSLSWVMGGVLYPVDILPPRLEAAAWLLPITHAVSGLRQALTGHGSIAHTAAPLALFVIIALPISMVMFGAAARRARATGGLGHV